MPILSSLEARVGQTQCCHCTDFQGEQDECYIPAGVILLVWPTETADSDICRHSIRKEEQQLFYIEETEINHHPWKGRKINESLNLSANTTRCFAQILIPSSLWAAWCTIKDVPPQSCLSAALLHYLPCQLTSVVQTFYFIFLELSDEKKKCFLPYESWFWLTTWYLRAGTFSSSCILWNFLIIDFLNRT